jgi:Zn-dependent peptidase ImmA (M78 family)
MKAYLDKFAELKCGWNERPLTDEDFFRLCKKFRIAVKAMPLRRRGYYSRVKGKHHIAISDRLSEFQAAFVRFHELGHFLMHAEAHGQTTKFSGKCEGAREETEADAFAYCAMLPLELLRSIEPEILVGDHGYPPGFLMERLKVYERYGI